MTVTKLKQFLFVSIVSLALGLQSVSQADESNSVASITDAGGTVMVDRGKGFVTSKVGEKLYENDRVITLDGSMAEITYTDGCRTKLKSNNLIVINLNPGCKAAILDATKAAPQTVAATHPASIIPPLAGAGIVIGILTISSE